MNECTTNPTPHTESVPTAAVFPLFNMGRVCATPGALDALTTNKQNYIDFLSRHVTGDWLEMCEDDQETNRNAVDDDVRVFSAYSLKNGSKLWVITEHDRSVTTLLLPSEY